MFASRFRFHGHGSLKFLHRNAQVVRSRYCTIKSIKNPRRKYSRFAVIVSKKVHKAAVGRNRVRRRVYEILRLAQPYLDDNIDIAVIITSGEAIEAPHEELTQTIIEQLRELGVYHQ